MKEMFGNIFNLMKDGTLRIELKVSAIGKNSIRDLPPHYNSSVAVIGVNGVATVKEGQRIKNSAVNKTFFLKKIRIHFLFRDFQNA